MRTPVIAGNWKMNLLVGDALSLVEELKELLAEVTDVEIVVCPPYTALYPVGQALAGSTIALGGQDCYPVENGAYTGEISPSMLKDAGCAWTIVGHSERRRYFDETDDFLNRKLKFALASDLKVMFCVGETLEEREAGEMDEVLRRQVREGLEGLREADFGRLLIAYEPVWAIGTGLTATPDQADEAHGFVRALVREQYGDTVSEGLRIQYGGSVKPENAVELMEKSNVDGALVGGASLKAESFASIVKAGVVAV